MKALTPMKPVSRLYYALRIWHRARPKPLACRTTRKSRSPTESSSAPVFKSGRGNSRCEGPGRSRNLREDQTGCSRITGRCRRMPATNVPVRIDLMVPHIHSNKKPVNPEFLLWITNDGSLWDFLSRENFQRKRTWHHERGTTGRSSVAFGSAPYDSEMG